MTTATSSMARQTSPNMGSKGRYGRFLGFYGVLACGILVILSQSATVASASSPTTEMQDGEWGGYETLHGDTLEEDVPQQFGFLRGDDPALAANSTCASVLDCKSCSNAYTCHWCDADEACHAKGSPHGCSWGSSCKKKPAPKPKENTTCAAQTTCSQCTLSSHLCHWCESDDACHAVGSKYGCSVGVDCYSNDRCRRTTPEKLEQIIITKMPFWAMAIAIGIASSLIGCISCCYCCAGGVKGAYDDLATITMAASVAPLSVIGGPTFRASEFRTNLEPHQEEDEEHASESSSVQVQNGNDEEEAARATATPAATTSSSAPTPITEPDTTPAESATAENNLEHGTSAVVLDDDEYVSFENSLSRPLLSSPISSPSRDPSQPTTLPDYFVMADMDPPSHMNRLFRFCSCYYYTVILLIVILTCASIYLYPIVPVYNVCNDSVAWSHIIAQLATFHLGASFEILISLQNSNHVNVDLGKGSGSFRYEGSKVGSFTIPPVLIGAMAVTDLMIVARLEPNKYQIAQIAADYYKGNLVFEADFTAGIHVPALFNLGTTYEKKGFEVDVNMLSDRSLCHCSTWDDDQNKTNAVLFLN